MEGCVGEPAAGELGENLRVLAMTVSQAAAVPPCKHWEETVRIMSLKAADRPALLFLKSLEGVENS